MRALNNFTRCVELNLLHYKLCLGEKKIGSAVYKCQPKKRLPDCPEETHHKLFSELNDFKGISDYRRPSVSKNNQDF